MIAVVVLERQRLELLWQPAGVVVTYPGGWRARWAPVTDTPVTPSVEAAFSQALTNLQPDSFEAWRDPVARITRSGLSGHLWWLVAVEVPDSVVAEDLYRHYVEDGEIDPYPGSTPLAVAYMPYG